MPFPFQITFRGIDHSDAIETVIRQRASHLERFSRRIVRCHVIVDVPHQHRQRGNHFAIRVDIETLRGTVAATRDPSLDDSHRDLLSVVRDAFDAVTRQLEDDAQRRRGDVKAHTHHLPPGQ